MSKSLTEFDRDGVSTVIPQQPCPSCGYKLNRARAVKEEGLPSPGDVTVCIECVAWLVFNEALELRVLPLEEIEALDHETFNDMRKVSRAIMQVKARRN
jgi:hypothetical protein